jgi:hypothetical protein
MPTEGVSGGLATEVRNAFADVPRPSGAAVAPHECPECHDVRRLLEPHAFEAVPDDVLDYLGDSLPFLGPAGLHYYLPAYLLRAIREPDWAGLEMLMFHLSPSAADLAERGEYWRERLAVFSPVQRGAIRAFIEGVASSEQATQYSEEITRARLAWTPAT